MPATQLMLPDTIAFGLIGPIQAALLFAWMITVTGIYRVIKDEVGSPKLVASGLYVMMAIWTIAML